MAGQADYNEAEHRRSVVSKFHDLVKQLGKERQTMKKEDHPSTLRVFEEAATRLKFDSEKLPNNHLGSVPGVEVGDVFQSRRLLRLIGLHSPLRAGIYYLNCTETGRKTLATSVVFSGGYEDDIDNGDVIIYAGHGGQDPHRRGEQVSDQALTQGNEALENSYRNKQPVRVIRSCDEVPCGYRYDGLYNVENCWVQMRPEGFLVYKFKLRRKPEQPLLASHRVEIRATLHGKKRKGIKQDISQGRENIRIPVVNSVDNVYTLDDFEYNLRVNYPACLHKPELMEGCSCNGGCTDSKNCVCAGRNGGQFPYRDRGTLVEPKVVVYECGPNCTCLQTCKNRVAQRRGLKHELEIFRTPKQDWGVRTLEFIEADSFIAEYTGDLILDRSPNSSNSKFIIPIFCKSTEGRDDNDVVSVSPPQLVDKGYKVDSSKAGNVSRFIRRNSSPNIYVQYVLHDHHDTDIPHVMLFALENIPPGLELSLSSSLERDIRSKIDKPRINSRFRK